MKHPRGALVAKVLPDSPALSSGINVGDIIVTFNDQDVVNSSSLPPIVGSSEVGVKLPVTVIRNGREKTLHVKLGELPEDEAVAQATTRSEKKVTNRLGFSAIELSDKKKQELEIEGGVEVGHIVSGAASKAGVRKGDIILAIDNTAVTNLRQFKKMVEGLKTGRSVALLVQRDGSPTFLAIKVPPED
jgi:serine protease Do